METQRLLPYKFDANFTDLKEFISFYTSKIGKTEKAVLSITASMGNKGLITYNPDNTVTVTWFFRNYTKYNKFVQAYLDFQFIPSVYVSSKVKIDYE